MYFYKQKAFQSHFPECVPWATSTSPFDMLGTMGLAAAVFSPWMNVTGSILANYWRKRPVAELEESNGPSPMTHAQAP